MCILLLSITLLFNNLFQGRHRHNPCTISPLRDSNWHSAASITTKCFSWCTISFNARGGFALTRNRQVISFVPSKYTQFASSLFTDAAVLIDDPKSHIQPTMPELQRWNAGQQESIRAQVALTETKSARESANAGRAMSEDALRKRKEREERKKAEALRLAEIAARSDGDLLAPSEPTPAQVPPIHSDSPVSAAGNQGEPLSSIPYAVVVSAPSSSFEWYNPSGRSYSTLKDARAAGVWDYPSTLEERAKCGVFSGLWKQGFFMGGGIKFGGDYLVYPGSSFHHRQSSELNLHYIAGDPLRYHSHFAASVLVSPISSLRPMEIVAHGRLGTATKKAHLLCGWDDEKQEVSYLSIEWAGFG